MAKQIIGIDQAYFDLLEVQNFLEVAGAMNAPLSAEKCKNLALKQKVAAQTFQNVIQKAVKILQTGDTK